MASVMVGDVAYHHSRELHDESAEPLIFLDYGVDIDMRVAA